MLGSFFNLGICLIKINVKAKAFLSANSNDDGIPSWSFCVVNFFLFIQLCFCFIKIKFYLENFTLPLYSLSRYFCFFCRVLFSSCSFRFLLRSFNLIPCSFRLFPEIFNFPLDKAFLTLGTSCCIFLLPSEFSFSIR